MQYDEIKYVGLHDLNPLEQESVHKIAIEYFPKMKREVDNLVSMKVTIKTHHIGGKRKKYSIHVQMSSPGHTFTSTRAVDWDISRTMHKSCTECLAQIIHRIHPVDRRPRRK